MKIFMAALLLSFSFMITETSNALDIKTNDPAPQFKVKTQTGADFDLMSRKGKWTILYFYPKAGTPGCTKQACAFRDSIGKIRELGAEVYGVSTDTIQDQKNFHKEQKLNFDLLADVDGKITQAYGSKMPLMNISKRWTFIIDPELKIRNIMKEVDPATDSERVVAELSKLKKISK